MNTTSPADSANDPAPPARRGWFAPAFWLLVCAALVVFGIRSRRRTDVLALYTRSGNVQGIMSHHGRVLLVMSSLSLGPEKALSAEVVSVPVDEGQALYDLVYGTWDKRRDWGRFGFLASQRGEVVGDATHVVLTAPHWLLAALAGLPVVSWVAGVLRRVRRRRRGWCLGCGYDLRGAPSAGGVCPECGRPTADRMDRASARTDRK